jgi:Ca-activated chloride channel family protein
VNRELIESVARAGGGEAEVVTDSAGASAAAKRVLKSIASPVLAKVRIETEGFDMAQVTPQPCPDVFAARALAINGEWHGKPEGTIIVRGIAGNGETFARRIDVAAAAAQGGLDHPALPVLWARERVRLLAEQGPAGPDEVAAITALGLEYALLTPYTSFVAVDETPRELARAAVPVKQPLPLPQGVTAAAIGSTGAAPLVRNGSVPEPGAIGLVTLLVILLAMQRGRN